MIKTLIAKKMCVAVLFLFLPHKMKMGDVAALKCLFCVNSDLFFSPVLNIRLGMKNSRLYQLMTDELTSIVMIFGCRQQITEL